MKEVTGFSVLMSVYRKEKPEYLWEAVESVVQQTLLPDEIVLVEDGPLTEELYETIHKLCQRYDVIRTVPLSENMQLGRALAEGIKNCRYELIARMDTDDIAVSNRFELQYTYMREHPEVAVLGGYIEEFDEKAPDYHQVKYMPHMPEELQKYAKYRNPVNHMTVMYRKKAVLDAGNYSHFPFLEDYELWNRMLKKGYVFANLPCVLVKARTNADIYERRGGKTYCKIYMQLRRKQREYGLLTWSEYQIAKLLTFVMTRQPTVLRKLLYRKTLRK